MKISLYKVEYEVNYTNDLITAENLKLKEIPDSMKLVTEKELSENSNQEIVRQATLVAQYNSDEIIKAQAILKQILPKPGSKHYVQKKLITGAEGALYEEVSDI